MHPTRVLREPLLHFFAIGVLLFAVFSWVDNDGMRPPDEIAIDAERIAAIESQFERVWQRPPTPDEMAGLVDNWIREEVFYREGMALGLDRNDPVLRRRLAQKMEFISEGLVDIAPTEAELRSYFDANAADYRLDARVSFRQLYFDPADYGESLGAVLDRALDDLAEDRVPGGAPTLLPPEMTNAGFGEVRRTFGDRFADALEGLPVGEWVGPIESGFGVHLVRIEQVQQARLPGFDDVRAAVETDFRAEQVRDRKDAIYEALRERYTVTLEDGVMVVDQADDRDRK